MKIGIIGCGNVGSAAAFAMVLRGIGSEIALVDQNHDLAQVQAEDISHATPFSNPVKVIAGGYECLQGADVVVITAGAAQRVGESRLELLARNAEIFKSIVASVMEIAPEAIWIFASNPVDVMTQLATQLSGKPPEKVIGSGTILDTARFRALLAEHLQVSPQSVHASVLGEHGDSEVLHWSGATVGGLNVHTVAEQAGRPLTKAIMQDIDAKTRGAAAHIIAGKGATWFGIGAGLARLCRAIIDNERNMMTCSVVTQNPFGLLTGGLLDGGEVALSLPRIIGSAGVIQTITPTLDEVETQALKNSIRILCEAYGGLSLNK